MSYNKLGAEIGDTVASKQAAYGDSFGKSGQVMRILYPDGIPPSKLDDALTVVRVLDKLFRIATDRDALGESPWRDIAGYALLSVARQEKQRTKVDGDNRMPVDGYAAVREVREATEAVPACRAENHEDPCRKPDRCHGVDGHEGAHYAYRGNGQTVRW